MGDCLLRNAEVWQSRTLRYISAYPSGLVVAWSLHFFRLLKTICKFILRLLAWCCWKTGCVEASPLHRLSTFSPLSHLQETPLKQLKTLISLPPHKCGWAFCCPHGSPQGTVSMAHNPLCSLHWVSQSTWRASDSLGTGRTSKDITLHSYALNIQP